MPRAESTHERLASEHEVKLGSDRAFGLVFAGFFTIVGGVKLWAGHSMAWSGAWFAAAAAMLLVALVVPRILRPLNILWFRFGLLLHRVVSPLVMGLMFYVAVTPVGLIMRLLGKRPLNLAFEPAAESYWIERRPPGPPPASMTNQF